MPLDKKECKTGMKVQDGNGEVGTIRWIGRMEKSAKPPRNDVGTYCAVEFEPRDGVMTRTNGSWAGKKYCSAPEGTVAFLKPKMLEKEMNTEGISAIRKKLGDRIADWDDSMVIRFLVARKYDIGKVETMINDHLKWRESFNPTYHEYFPPEMAADYPVGFGEGLDRDGNLLYFERPGNGGNIDGKEFVRKFGIPMISRWHAAVTEEGLHRLHKHRSALRVTMVVDLSGFATTDRQVMSFAKAIAKIDQDNYPEYLNKLFLINAPSFFSGLWRLIRVFVDDRTKDKIHVLGKDYKDTVAESIDEKYWPKFMGGTNDSWLHKGGIAGKDDPTLARNPETGTMELDDNEFSDEQIQAASMAMASPPAASLSSQSSSSASSGDESSGKERQG